MKLTDITSGKKIEIFLDRDKNGNLGIYVICNTPNKIKLISMSLEEIYKGILSEYKNRN